MDEARKVAELALESTVEMCASNGFTDVFRTLVQEVYSVNQSRHEPDELGDTAMSFGIQCSENLKTRALRRFRHDEDEPTNRHWNIDGLRVGIPRNVLTFSFGNIDVVSMKVPSSAGRSSIWDHSSDWDNDSHARRMIAAKNSDVLQYRSPAPGAVPLFPHEGSPGEVQNYMVFWAGETNAPLTAGWLGIPVLGETPFIAQAMLWWDDEPRSRITTKATPDRGPSFDQRPAAKPEVSLKRRLQEGQA